jgi:hypothetical protein
MRAIDARGLGARRSTFACLPGSIPFFPSPVAADAVIIVAIDPSGLASELPLAGSRAS